jgi:Ca-activated chloride channel family protein
MPDRETDQTLDTRLRNVPVPDGLADRLRGIAALSDEELDYRLRSVPSPIGMLQRIKQEVADELLDQQIRDVALPSQVVPRARVIPDRRRRSRIGRLALAASLLIVVGAGYFAAIGGLLTFVRPKTREPIALVTIDQGPLKIVSPFEETVRIVPGSGILDEAVASTTEASNESEIPLLQVVDTPVPGPAGQLFSEINDAWDPWDDWLLMRWGVLGYSHHDDDALPDLKTLVAPAALGIEAPLARAFDREFLYSRGVHPPVLTSFERSASAITAPLCTNTASVETARRLVAQDRLPNPEEVRVEDFLAAMDYQYAPAKPGRLAIRTAAGPSVFNPSAAGLLQIGVKAGVPCARTLPATHLVVALDISASMGWEGKLDMARRGLCKMFRHLGPNDRFSLILFNDETFHVVDEGRSEDAEGLVGILERLDASGGANLGAALQTALSAAIETQSTSPIARRLVLITDGRSVLGEDESHTIEGMLGEAAHLDFRFDVFDLGDGAEPDKTLADAAAVTDGLMRSVQSAEQIRWSLFETLTGDPSLVASEAELHVEFNPKAVAAYRLIGHEATAVGGLLPASVESDLRVGQEATVLFEVWLYPNDEDDVALARLQWNDPDSGEPQRAQTQRISRIQFATSFEGSAICLQAATIAAETAEILRQSFNFAVPSPGAYRYRPKPRNLLEVLAVARHVNPRLAARPDFRRLVSLLESARRITIERRAGLTRAGQRGIIGGYWRES